MSGKQKTALVTGSSSGIGKALVHFLADEGWTVFAAVRKKEDGARLQEHSVNIKPIILDVTEPETVNRAVDEVRVAVGSAGLDVLVNNAGLACAGPVEFTPMSDVMKQFEVNFFGYVRMIQAAMPLIRMGTPGRVINIGSIGSEFGTPFIGIYQATKSALLTMSEALRREVARWGVKVVLIQPGAVKTEFEDRAMQEYKKLDEMYPKGSACDELFGKDIKHFPEASAAIMKDAADAKVVVKRIYQAMTVKNPKNIYHDTWGSYFNVLMVHLLPYSWMDSMLAKYIFAKE